MPPCYLLVFSSQLDSPFVEKGVETTFFIYLLYIYMKKSYKKTLDVTPICSPAFLTLKLCTNHSMLILN